MRQAKYHNAINDFSQTVQINPNDAETYYLLAQCQRAINDTAGAQNSCRLAAQYGYVIPGDFLRSIGL